MELSGGKWAKAVAKTSTGRYLLSGVSVNKLIYMLYLALPMPKFKVSDLPFSLETFAVAEITFRP